MKRALERWGNAAVLLMCLSIGTAAQAGCINGLGGTGPSVYRGAPPPLPPFNPNVPVGSTLASTYFLAYSDFTTYVSCPGAIGNLTYTASFPELGGELFDIGVPGIALVLHAGFPTPNHSWHQFANMVQASPQRIWVRFVKTGPITQRGRLPAGQVWHSYFHDWSHLSAVVHLTTSLELIPSVPTCTPVVHSQHEPLPNWSLGAFDGTGRSPRHDFAINLDCGAGPPGSTAPVRVTLTDQTEPGNRSSKLTLAGGSEAKGFALEINNRHGLVFYGPASDLPGNPGQWFDGNASNGLYSIPLSINLLMTGTAPEVGNYTALMAYTLNYQ